LTVFDQIVLPFELFLNSGRLGYQQPFNQFGVTPRFGSVVQLFAGWYSTRISDLTVGDSRILGGGVELSPGPLRLALHYGYVEWDYPTVPPKERYWFVVYRAVDHHPLMQLEAVEPTVLRFERLVGRGRYRYAVQVMSATGQSRLSEEQVVVVE
jgi:hypothetical protein